MRAVIWSLTIPCVKQTKRGLALEILSSIRPGISGSAAPLASHRTNTTHKTRPDTRMLRTLGEFHGNTTPPRSRLSKVNTVMLTMAAVPIQSILRPSLALGAGVLGVALRNM
jgi:hypothetical protein